MKWFEISITGINWDTTINFVCQHPTPDSICATTCQDAIPIYLVLALGDEGRYFDPIDPSIGKSMQEF